MEDLNLDIEEILEKMFNSQRNENSTVFINPPTPISPLSPIEDSQITETMSNNGEDDKPGGGQEEEGDQDTDELESDDPFDKENEFLQKLKIVFGKTEDFIQFEKELHAQKLKLNKIKELSISDLVKVKEENRALELKAKEDKKEIATLKEQLRICEQKSTAYLASYNSLKKRIVIALKNKDKKMDGIPYDSSSKISKENAEPVTVTKNELRSIIQTEIKALSSSSDGDTKTNAGLINDESPPKAPGATPQDPTKATISSKYTIPGWNSSFTLNTEQQASFSGYFGASGASLGANKNLRKREKSDDSSDSNYVPPLKTQCEEVNNKKGSSFPLLFCRAPNCGKSFLSKVGLKLHEIGVHGIKYPNQKNCSGRFQMICPYCSCGREYRSRQSLEEHKNALEGRKPYVCSLCGIYKSAYKGNVTNHMKKLCKKMREASQAP